MHTYFLHLAYNGNLYRGWQRQPGTVKSVQATFEDTLSKILKTKITLYGCGRTDSMVHASQYFAHINLHQKINKEFVYIFNKNLPHELSCFEIIEVENHRHSRYDAQWRTYNYHFHEQTNPYINTLSTLIENTKYNFQDISDALQLLTQYTNYGGLCTSPDKHNHTQCNVTQAKLYKNKERALYRFEFTANRYLKTMIRIIVSKLLSIGKGELSISRLEECLQTGKTTIPLKPAPPQGLHLTKIEYPYLSRPNFGDVFFINNPQIWQEM